MNIIPLALIAVASILQPPVQLGNVRAIHLLGQAEAIGANRKVCACFIEKLQALGPFVFTATPEEADATIAITSTIQTGAKRILLKRAPEATAVVTAQDGRELWRGTNKYKKGTTVWGGSSDLECGVANGLANKLVGAIEKARR